MAYVYHTEDVLTYTDDRGQAVTDSFGVTECYAINPNNGGVTHVPCPAASSTAASSSSSSSSNQNNNNGKPTLVLPIALGSVLGFFVLLTTALLILFFRRRRRRNEEALGAEKLDHPAYSLTPFAPRQSILAETEVTGLVEGAGGGREAATTTTAGRRRSFRREDEQWTEEEDMGRMMTREMGGGAGEDDDVLTRKLEGWKAVAVAREGDIAGQGQWGSRDAERMKQNPFGDSNSVYNCGFGPLLLVFSSSSSPSLPRRVFFPPSLSDLLPSPNLRFLLFSLSLSSTTSHQHLYHFLSSALLFASKQLPPLLVQLPDESLRLLSPSHSHHLLPSDWTRRLNVPPSSPRFCVWSSSSSPAGRRRWSELDAFRRREEDEL
ncbi:hypothetical protein BDY24DRAFT_398552 [Mrakia frigida]|uniref:uncharacterized protein n=1 Tax=Mrakia frigida TaxID=29902 RepID=UPI003FCC1F4B